MPIWLCWGGRVRDLGFDMRRPQRRVYPRSRRRGDPVNDVQRTTQGDLLVHSICSRITSYELITLLSLILCSSCIDLALLEEASRSIGNSLSPTNHLRGRVSYSFYFFEGMVVGPSLLAKGFGDVS